MSKEDARPDFRGNITEQLAVARDLEYMASIGRYYGEPNFDLDRFRFPATFEPETGDKRSTVIRQCETILSAGVLLPENFNQFVTNMIDLVGGKRFSQNIEASFVLPDQHGSRTISLLRARSDGLDFGSIRFGPAWLERDEFRLERKTNERGVTTVRKVLTYGYSDYNMFLFIPQPTESTYVCLPNNAGVSLETLLPSERIYNNTLVTSPKRIPNRVLLEKCREVFEVYKKQDTIPVSATGR